jgi:hypothetical protein
MDVLATTVNKSDTSTLDKWIYALSEQRKNILWGSLALILILIIGYKFMSTSEIVQKKAMLQAEMYFNEIQRENDAAVLEDLLVLLQTYPALLPKYQGGIAQALLRQGQAMSALPIAEGALARTAKYSKDKDLAQYHQYAETSLLISQGKMKESLAPTKDLQTAVDGGKLPVLKAFSLIRIAMLQESLGNREEELLAWKDFQELANTNILVQRLYNDESLKLKEYIAQRLKA